MFSKITMTFIFILTLTFSLKAQEREEINKHTVSHEVSVEVESSIEEVYEYITDSDMPVEIIKRHGIVPGPVSSELLNDQWSDVGDKKRLTFSDKSTSIEEILVLDDPNYYAYKVYDFSNPLLNPLIKEIKGEWFLKELENGKTLVSWKYTFNARNWRSKQVLRVLIFLQFNTFMSNVMPRLKAKLEN